MRDGQYQHRVDTRCCECNKANKDMWTRESRFKSCVGYYSEWWCHHCNKITKQVVEVDYFPVKVKPVEATPSG